MNAKLKNILLSLLALVLLAGFAAAILSPAITPEAQDAYLGESAADDEYAFLFD